ncbi:MAG: heparinase II/III family protein [Bacteroidales bacterium]|nr:heparinase II/III family protein [Bacteroidales bacterium]
MKIRLLKLLFAFFLLGLQSLPLAAQAGPLSYEYAKPGVAASFKPGGAWLDLPPYNDRAAWQQLLGERYAEKLIKDGEKYLKYNWRHIPASAYLEFERSGNRDVMQGPDGRNYTALSKLMFAELAEGKGRFLDKIADGMFFFTWSPSWVTSAHMIRQQSKRALPSGEQLIDLGSGRIGAIMSYCWFFFHEAVDAIDPSISANAREAIRRNILRPFLDDKENEANWWLGFNPKRHLNNWTPWCNANVILCYLLVEDDPYLLDRALLRSVRSVDRFLTFVNPDGACEEGPSYWNHAAGKYYDYLQMLYDASGGAFNLLNDPLLRRMGEYESRADIGAEYTVNFADAVGKSSASAALVWRYGNAVQSPELRAYAGYRLASYSKKRFSTPPLPSGNDAYRDFELMRCRKALSAYIDTLNTEVGKSSFEEVCAGLRREVPADSWYPQTQHVFVRSRDGWFLGAKGGHNGESHNHNDVGNFILYIADTPIIVDAGAVTYTRQTFSNERYDIWVMQSGWHNTPVINGSEQMHGSEYKASDVAFGTKDGKHLFTLDLHGAYSDSLAACKSWKRTLLLEESEYGTSLTLRDTWQLSRRLGADAETFLVRGKVYLPGEHYKGRSIKLGEAVLENGPVAVLVNYPKSLEASVEVRVLDDPKMSKVWGNSLSRLRLTSTPDASLKGNCQIRFTRLQQ